MEASLGIRFLSKFRINTSKKNLFFITTVTRQDLIIARLLKERGLIRRMFKLHTGPSKCVYYAIYPNYTICTNTNLRVLFFNKNADHLTLTLQALRMMNLASGASSFILKTDRGVLTHQDAIKAKVGGILLCLIL